ncbi:flippase-like domain-containing protein [Actinospica durhamensis]|uniref:Flippase-like domain-containing protein n=1 Tax=Actinospica durhamensis TaxID=1508375 RepID=A0A941ESE2_9ACTN|nr:lysylphosphatidylglycerol synthase transmembrane domain-containing protein [Actinospica durhamensis]MBR7835623.1 flippase-like domain-containing protein [Actinospica durhamensis]
MAGDTWGERSELIRIRRRPDLIHLLVNMVAVGAVVAVGTLCINTTNGLQTDIQHGFRFTPAFLLDGVALLTRIAAYAVPLGIAVEQALRGQAKRVADAVVAAAFAYAIAGSAAPDLGCLAAVVAALTILGFDGRPALRAFACSCIAIYSVTAVVDGTSGLVGFAAALALGRAVAFGWRYARGVATDRLTAAGVMEALVRAGLEPVDCSAEDREARRFAVRCADGGLLDVHLLERDRQAARLIHRVNRLIRLRAGARRREMFGLRRAVSHEALISYALRNAGINTPTLLAVREVSADATLLAYEHVPARVLGEIPGEELTDATVERVWKTVRELGRHQIAHRRLSPTSILVDDDGHIWLTDLRHGEIAATELQQLLDVAEAMTSLAIKVGPERAVRIGAEVLGEHRIGATLPVLQKIVLTRATRAAVGRSGRLLAQLRKQVLTLESPTEAAAPVKLERLRLKTVLAATAGCVAVYGLMAQISSAEDHSGHGLWRLIASASPGWLLLAGAAAALTYVAAAAQLAGFIPESLPKARNLMVQLASSFFALFAPAGLGGVTLNVRFLRKRGIADGAAVTAVGASQAIAFIAHLVLVAVFGFFVGSAWLGSATGPLGLVLALALLTVLTLAVPPVHRFAQRRLAPFFEGSLPRLIEVAQDPRKLALALGGTLAISLLNTLCLWSCIHALTPHGAPSYAKVAFLYLTVQAATAAVPTPAGMGAVEVGLSSALVKAASLASPSVVIAVLGYRLLTTYLPPAPGYVALLLLRRRNTV